MEWNISVLRDCKIFDTFHRNYARHTQLSEMFVKFTWLRSLVVIEQTKDVGLFVLC